MRLSTERERDDRRSIAVIHAALDCGVTMLDTADAYCWDIGEVGHNERLIAEALASWNGDRSTIQVATKGGLTRPNGEWIPDGRAKHLAAACEASCRALGVARIDLYQLHAPDPRSNFATSVRALAALQRDGLIDRVGLCNVTVGQLEEARRIVDIAAVQVELNAWNDSNFLSGIVDHCLRNAIQVIASRPLGGVGRRRRTESDPLLAAIAARHRITPFEAALAWLADLSPGIVPIPGASTIQTAASIGASMRITLTSDDRAQLDERFIAAANVRQALRAAPAKRPPRRDGEIVMVIGLPGAGKSTAAQTFVDQGYTRLNRDSDGGSLRDLIPTLRQMAGAGTSRFVLDNTYVSRKSRAALLQAVAPTGLPVRCVWLQTSIDDAQVNAAWRMVSKFGRLLDPDEIRKTVKHDVNAFGPSVQFRYQRELEPPDIAEGFCAIDVVPFVRRTDPSYDQRAVLLWCDGVLTDHPERDAVLRRLAADGSTLLGLGWQNGAAPDPYDALRRRVGVAIDIQYCSHGGGPPACWCRKPLPGLGVYFIQKYRLNPAACVYVAAGPHDPGYARRLGFQYRPADDFFAC